MRPNILIVGVGGRTGSMFAKELGGVCRIIGVGRDPEINTIVNGGMVVRAGDLPERTLQVAAIRASDYEKSAAGLDLDYVFLTTRNPIGEIVKNYYRPFVGQNKIPALIISQNGLSALDDARKALDEIFGADAAKIGIIRISLIDPVDARVVNGRTQVSYRLPVRLGFGGVGKVDTQEIANLFRSAGIKAEQFFGAKILAMERSKLFMNLIGMVSAASGLPVSEGLGDPRIFRQEVLMLREYAMVVKKSRGKFVTLAGYPIGQISFLLNNLPLSLLIRFRHKLIKVVAGHRNNKPKDLGEIDYYNGEIVRLGVAAGVPTPVNAEIVRLIKPRQG